MPVIPWECAHGDPPPAVLSCAATVDLAPADDSVDTNTVQVTGSGSISSFGPGAGIWITKRVQFPAGITLINGANLNLLTGANRVTSHSSYGVYRCDPTGVWTEISFNTAAVGLMMADDVGARLEALESRVGQIENRLGGRR